MTTIIGGSSPSITFSDSTTQITAFTSTPIVTALNTGASTPMTFSINGSEAMRIDSSGNLLVGTTSSTNSPPNGICTSSPTSGTSLNIGHANGTPNGYSYMQYSYNGTTIGYISQNGTTAVAYNTTSDYRLKENIAPMTGALDTVAKLKPVTYKWKADGSNGQGFIAHELQAVVPDCVTGQKDAVDAEGKPIYQGVDTSFLVATLTAAIQEQQALIESLKPPTPTEAQAQAKASALAKLTALGLTPDEVKALIGE
jgi:Chaperone of endosialidase